MALYICLETGRFWFPAQVYKVTVSKQYCYDSLVSYDSKKDIFRARSPNVGRRVIERDIHRDRLRIPPPKTFLVDYYELNGLTDLNPRDQFEIQKRRSRSSPHCDWAYAEICHLQSCDKDINHCSCHDKDNFLMRIGTVGYLMSRSVEEKLAYDELNCYKGIRKLNDEEIEKWDNLILARDERIDQLNT